MDDIDGDPTGSAENIAVQDNPSELRYELVLDKHVVGEILYRLAPDTVVLIHTEVLPSHEGKGFGARLVAGALDDIRDRGLQVVPFCPFVRSVHSPSPRLRGSRCAGRGGARLTPTPEQERGPTRTYAGDAIEVLWEPRLCIHVRNCLRGLPQVFNPEARPWVAVDGADADAIAAAVETCPTGALRYRRLDGGRQEQPPTETTIEQRPNGPLFVRGLVRIVDPDGRLIREETRVALCRCGASENKPFCDGSHRRIGFTTASAEREEQ